MGFLVQGECQETGWGQAGQGFTWLDARLQDLVPLSAQG